MCIKGTLERVSLFNFKNFDNPEIAYSDFITKLDCVINAIAPFMTVRTKNNAGECFDGEIAEKMQTRDKLYKIFKSKKIHVDKKLNKEFKI